VPRSSQFYRDEREGNAGLMRHPERSEAESKELLLLFVDLKGHGFTACGKC
jgi:hypothetical protein